MEQQGADLSTRMEQQGADLSTRMEQQGADLSTLMEQQARGVVSRIAGQVQQVEQEAADKSIDLATKSQQVYELAQQELAELEGAASVQIRLVSETAERLAEAQATGLEETKLGLRTEMEFLLEEARGRLDDSWSGARLELANATQQFHDELGRATELASDAMEAAAKSVRVAHANKLKELARQLARFQEGAREQVAEIEAASEAALARVRERAAEIEAGSDDALVRATERAAEVVASMNGALDQVASRAIEIADSATQALSSADQRLLDIDAQGVDALAALERRARELEVRSESVYEAHVGELEETAAEHRRLLSQAIEQMRAEQSKVFEEAIRTARSELDVAVESARAAQARKLDRLAESLRELEQ
jgi:hypothetical protein